MDSTKTLRTSTLTPAKSGRDHAARPEPHLFLVLHAERPLAAPARYRLKNAETVAVGRGLEDLPARFDRADGGLFKLSVPDRSMSSSHAILRRDADEWILEDAKSKNGTFVDGQRRDRTVLEDGALIELGQTFFIFRQALLTTEQADLPHWDEGEPPTGLATLVPSLIQEFQNLKAIARSSVSVIIHGESGTGKELVARAVHQVSNRGGEFVGVNCGGIASNLVESELFGYRKGAFSGAIEDRPGLIRSADRGTFFLDEIGDLPASAQAVFLRVLQEAEVVPVGGTRPVKVDLRVVSATHRDLEALVSGNKFRADLLARLSGLTLNLPPLRRRREDLGLLIAAVLRRHYSDRAEAISFSADAARALLLYSWPLNVRELEKCLTTALVLGRGARVEAPYFSRSIQNALHDFNREDSSESAEELESETPADTPLSAADQQRRSELVELLRAHDGNVTAVARALGKARFQVQRWLRRYRIDSTKYRQ